MILYSRLITLLIIAVLGTNLVLRAQENLLNFENSLKFARYLSASGQYASASEEFERLNFLWPGDETVMIELVRNYRLGKQCDKLIPSMDLLTKDDLIFKSRDYSHEFLRFALDCKNPVSEYINIASSLTPKENAFYTTAYYWIIGPSDSIFNITWKNQEILAQNYPELYLLSLNFEGERYKKPGLALLMSMIIPGSGKAYSKNWGDAVVSFLFVGTNAYASYRAFNKKGVGSVNGWIFGGLGVSFYTANIWGSFKAAKKYNTNLNIQYQKNAERIIYNNY